MCVLLEQELVRDCLQDCSQNEVTLAVAILTRAMCHHASRQLLLVQSRQRMEGSSDFKCANALVVLTFEEELNRRVCWSLPFEGSTDKSLWCLWARCKDRKGRGRQDRREMDVVSYALTGGLNRGALQR